MEIAFVGASTDSSKEVMQAVKTMCRLLQKKQQKGWLCEKIKFVDCKSGKRREEREKLEKADFLVVNFEQSYTAIEHYFQTFQPYQEKSFYLVYNYWEQYTWNRSTIQRICRMQEERLGILPYNEHLLRAHHEQSISKYIDRHWFRPEIQEKNFFRELVWISQKIIQQAEKKRKAEFFN